MNGDTDEFPRRRSPIERFLGPEAATGGPFALLGVPMRDCSDEAVISALEIRLDQVVAHAESDTPEGDEVRLALHAAAAQLLDPSVRRHLMSRWGGGVSAAPSLARSSTPTWGLPPTPLAPASRAPVPIPDRPREEFALEHDAILTLAMFGGWNKRSLRRLTLLAHARGLSSHQLAATLRHLATRRRRGGTRGGPRIPAEPTRPVPTRATAPPRLTGAAAPVRSASARPIEPESDPLPEQIDPAVRSLRLALLIGGVAVGAMGVALTVLYLVTSSAPPPPPVPPPPAPIVATPTPIPAVAGDDESMDAPAPTGDAGAAQTGRESDRAGAPGAVPTVPAPKPEELIADPVAVAREVASATGALGVAPDDALVRFGRAVRSLGAHWARYSPDRLIAAHDAVIEFIYRSAALGEPGERAVETVAAGSRPTVDPRSVLGPAQVWPAAWSVGMLNRLSVERDLPASVASVIESRLGAALAGARPYAETTFAAGAIAALQAIPRHLVPRTAGVGEQFPTTSTPAQAGATDELEVWRRWIGAVEAVAGTGGPLRSRLILSALDALLTRAPEPTRDKRVFDAVGELATRLTWRADEESRRWLLRWFDDRSVTPADLYALTSALATKSSAEGVDLTMVLSSGATDADRADLRARYAVAWGLDASADHDAFAALLADASRQAIARSRTDLSPAEHLATTVVLSRLAEAASWSWRGEGGSGAGGGEASAILADLETPVERAIEQGRSSPVGITEGVFESGGGWAVRYLGAGRNIPVRLQLLQDLDAGISIGAVDAEVLAGEAFFGSPGEVRVRAAQLARRHADAPAMVNAILEHLPRVGANAPSSDLIGFVGRHLMPPVKDPTWPVVARRVLVERLLELLASEDEQATIDRLSKLLAVSYHSRAARAPLSQAEREAPVHPPIEVSAGELWARWRADVGATVSSARAPLSLAEIESRRAGRLEVASGLVQAFAAEQSALAELLAYQVASERPDRAAQIAVVMAELGADRRRAGHVFQQLSAAERAGVQLWLIRFGEETL